MERSKPLNKLMNKAKSADLNTHQKKQLKELHDRYMRDLAEEIEHPKLYGIA